MTEEECARMCVQSKHCNCKSFAHNALKGRCLIANRSVTPFYIQGLDSIEFQQDVQQGFQQSTGHSVVLNALLKVLLNSLLKFN